MRHLKRNMLKSIRFSLMISTIMAMSHGSIAFGQQDSTILSFEQFIEIVRQNHPVVRQTELTLAQGDATVLSAKGNFDPIFYNDLSQKHFDNRRYYQLIDAGLKLPTRFGVTFNTGFNSSKGIFVNPENNQPNDGLVTAGLTIALGKGLLMDDRRAEIQKAELYRESTVLEQQIMLNDLIYNAGSAYWQWYKAYHILLIYEEAVDLVTTRFQAVRQAALLGDSPAIDTVEANIQLQNRMIARNKANLDFQNAGELLQTYLWIDGLIPVELQKTTIPEALETTVNPVAGEYLTTRDQLIAQHPKLKQYQIKLGTLEVDRKLKRESLRPTLDLKYNAISQATGNEIFAGSTSEDYLLGVQFKLPLFLRKGRGEFRMSKLKISDAEYDLRNQQTMFSALANQALNDWATMYTQVGLNNQAVVNYAQLLRGEQRLFSAGESSLFMVNNRELGYIKTRVDLIDSLAKYYQSLLKTDYAFGLLN